MSKELKLASMIEELKQNIQREDVVYWKHLEEGYIGVRLEKTKKLFVAIILEIDENRKELIVRLLCPLSGGDLPNPDIAEVKMKNCFFLKDSFHCYFNVAGKTVMPYSTKESQTNHPSYGQLQITKFSGYCPNLYGSSIEHNGGVTFSISESECERDLSSDHYHTKDEIIEITMSHNQFVEAITSGMNTSGVPVTITRRDGRRIAPPDFVNKRAQFDNEFALKMAKLEKNIGTIIEDAETLLKGSKAPNKGEREHILNSIQMLKQEVGKNVPYMKVQFDKQMDKTVVEAKAEIDGFYETKIRQFGLEAIEALKLDKPKIEK